MPFKNSKPTRFSLVIPAYNEAEVIEQAIREATEALEALVPEYEIIVVDDGSSDETAAIIQSLADVDPRLHLIRHETNQGYGAALRNGFQAAVGEWIAFTDADCQFDLSELDRLILLANHYDAVCGYRIDRQDSKLRCFYSMVYNWIVRLMLGIRVRDVDCALKVFRRQVLRRVDLQSDGFLVNSDLLTQVRDLGGSIVEVGVTHRPRAAGQSTVSVRHIPIVLVSLLRFWWNQVHFPAVQTTLARDHSPVKAKHLGWMQVGLIAIVCVFLFSNLGYPLIDRDETRYAEISREMLVSGDWTLPTLNYETYYDKPPMLYWLVASSYSVFGISEWSARLVPALAALGTLLLVMWFGNRHFDRKVGLVSAAILMLTAGFTFCSRYLLIDGVLTFLATASLLAAYEAIRDGSGGRVHWRWWCTASILCGLGFLTKGPLSVVLLLPPVVAYSWLTKDAVRLRWGHLAVLFFIVSAISIPWLVAVSLRDETFLWEFFVNHNVRRFAGRYHDRPVWYFIPVLLAAGFPWSFLAVPMTHHLVTQNRQVRFLRTPLLGFLCLWAVWMFVFFSASRCKLPTYLLPTAPAFALLLGSYVSRILTSSRQLDHWERIADAWSTRWAAVATCWLALVAIGIARFSGQTKGIGTMTWATWATIWLTLLGLLVVVFVGRRPRHFGWVSMAMLAGLLLVMVQHDIVPAYSRSQAIFASSSAEQREVDLDAGVAIATVAHEFSEVPFYLHRDDIKNFPNQDDSGLFDFVRNHRSTLLVVQRDILIGELRDRLPPGTRLQSCGFRGPARLVEATSAVGDVRR